MSGLRVPWLLAPCLAAVAALAPTPGLAQTAVSAMGPGQTRVDEDAPGRIRGELLDARTGEGAAGVAVALYRPRATYGRSWPEPWVDELPELDVTPIATVQTASEGQFLFEGLAPGQYRIAPLTSQRSESALVTVSRDAPDVWTSLAFGTGATVRGVVRGDGGASLEDVFVFVVGEDDGRGGNKRSGQPPEGRVFSGADGRFILSDLPPGVVWIQAARRDYGFAPPQRVELVERGEVGGLELVVRDERARIEAGAGGGGLGVVIAFDPRGIRVRKVLEGLPAATAGVEPGDRVLAIDGRSTLWMGRFEFLSLARGPVGEPAVLTLSRDGGAPFDVPVVRRKIPEP